MKIDYARAFRSAAIGPAYELACADPFLASNTLARGLAEQTRGSKLAAIRIIATALAKGEAGDFLRDAIGELERPR